jgi:hypothetical protein
MVRSGRSSCGTIHEAIAVTVWGLTRRPLLAYRHKLASIEILYQGVGEKLRFLVEGQR